MNHAPSVLSRLLQTEPRVFSCHEGPECIATVACATNTVIGRGAFFQNMIERMDRGAVVIEWRDGLPVNSHYQPAHA